MQQGPPLAAHPREPRPLRVVHLGKFYPPATGGMESHVRTLAQAQAALGAEVQVLCVEHRGSSGVDLTHAPAGRTQTTVEQDGAVRVHRLGKLASVARLEVCPELPAALSELARRKVDILHLHAPNPAMLLALLARPAFAKLVITHHSDVVRQRVLGAVFRPFERRGYARANAVLATSEAYAKASAALAPVRDRVEVLPLGIDLRPFHSPSPRARAYASTGVAGPGEPRWLMVGRLVYYKGLFTALEALREVPGQLWIVGQGPLEAELRARAAQLGLGERVKLLGRLDDDEVAGAYHAATALWFCGNARSEAFGLSQVEAMAAGLPVINTAIEGSGVAWVSRHEESGLTVPVGDAPALAAASSRLIADPALRARLGRGGQARALKLFSQEAMARRSVELYRRLLGAGVALEAPEVRPRLEIAR